MKWLAIFLLLAIPAFADTIDRVIVTTDITSVDALVAKAAGDKAGAPVLVAEDGLLTDELKAQISSSGATTVIVVGGPVVVPAATTDELQKLGYNVIRLWGIERTGTAIEVAKYFWQSSGCAVLVDDTKNSDVDTELQTPASTLASENDCPLIPVPAGVMPAEVLALLNDINATEVKLIARVTPDTAKLAKFRVKAIVGDRKKVEADVESDVEAAAMKEGKKLKLVIVAAPHWRHTLGAGAHPNERSVVRFVTNISQVPELITKIKDKNITDVRVVGVPALASEVADLLNQSGIIAKVVSGEKPAKVGHELLKEFREKWSEKKKKFEDKRLTQLAKIRSKLLDRLTDLEEKINENEIELQKLKEEGASEGKTAEVQAKIDAAKTKISALKADVNGNPVETTIREMAKLRDSVHSKKWEVRDAIKLRMRERFADEESDVSEVQKKADVSSVEGRLASLKEKCVNIQSLEDLVARAKSIVEEAKTAIDSGDHGKGSELYGQAKRVSESARHIADACEKTGKISDRLKNVAEKRADQAKKLEGKFPKRSGR